MAGPLSAQALELCKGIGKSITAEAFIAHTGREPQRGDIPLAPAELVQLGTTWCTNNRTGLGVLVAFAQGVAAAGVPHTELAQAALRRQIDSGSHEQLFAVQGGAYLRRFINDGLDGSTQAFQSMIGVLSELAILT